MYVFNLDFRMSSMFFLPVSAVWVENATARADHIAESEHEAKNRRQEIADWSLMKTLNLSDTIAVGRRCSFHYLTI